MRGAPSAKVIALCGNEGVDLLQEAFTYRLPWAMEAARVHALAMGVADATDLTGIAASAVEAGSSSRSVMVLLRAGLNSREAAIAAVESTGGTFENRTNMLAWLQSDTVQDMSADSKWPTSTSRHAWLQFLDEERTGERREWSWEKQNVSVAWTSMPPKAGTALIVERAPGQQSGLVLSSRFDQVGAVMQPLKRPRKDIVGVVAGPPTENSIDIEYFGPS